jgi:LmbE family N-acetylglucosaminyl deacetylase/predicted HAD superfamily hydrolase
MTIANEKALISEIKTSFPPVRSALVIAPHPDDEVFGCGGTLSLIRSSGSKVKTIIVTDGALGGDDADEDLSSVRATESRSAANALGLETPEFWGFSDRGVSYGELLIGRLIEAIQVADADLIFLPSPMDWHPDHQALAFAGAEAVRRLGGNRQAAFYEVTDPLPCPNWLQDITAVEEIKRQAMLCFTSQLKEQPYLDRIIGINRFRAFHLGAQVSSAEAFTVLSAADLDQGLTKVLDGPLAHRRRLGFASTGSDIPLVSVIIRSMDRPTLKTALDSLALQTYPNIEIVLVNAKGSAHQSIASWEGNFPLRLIGTGRPLRRSLAANMGMTEAQGEYLIFLDDDDWFDANHIHKLVAALRRQPQFKVAYTGVRCVDEALNPISSTFDLPFDAIRLRAGNLMPIHAVLFAKSLLALGCRMDESLDIYEDWDFWIQLSQHGDFLHVDGLSAIYRITQQTGFGINADPDVVRDATTVIYTKWISQLSAPQLIGLMQIVWHQPIKDGQISALSQSTAERDSTILSLRQSMDDRDERIDALNQSTAKGDATILLLRWSMEQHDLTIAALKTTLADQTRQITDQTHQITDQTHQITDQTHQITEQTHHISALTESAAYLNHVVVDRDARVAALSNSTSWQVTKPLRFIMRLLKGQRPLVAGGLRARVLQHAKQVYWRLPMQLRTPVLHWGYRNLGMVFRGMPHYEQWKGPKECVGELATYDSGMLLIDALPKALLAEGRVAIHLHMYYHDLSGEFAQYLKNMPFDYDLYVSVASEEGIGVCRGAFTGLARQGQLTVERVPNHGRDIAPMFCTFGARLKGYDYIAHLHSKKSLYNKGATEGWRQYLCGNLLGSEERIRRIFGLMQGAAARGIVYPQNYGLLPYAANCWLANKAMGTAWCARLGITPMPQGYFDFPAGSMFWARGDALKPLFDTAITIDDFAEEKGQTDGTFAHCLERLLVLSSLRQGFKPGIIKNLEHPTWSAWGFEQYVARSAQWMQVRLNDPAIKLIAFDIFDTLVCRPLMDPESVKAIVAERTGGETGKLYMKYRPLAEGHARDAAGRDIGMAEIYARMGELTDLSAESLASLRSLEEEIEAGSVTRRPEVVDLYHKALATGKPVVLISDMFLPRTVIEKILTDNGISGWNRLFISSEVGLRKDSGKLYDHVFEHYRISPTEMIMVGDNERSDLQIPCDKGVVGMHILKPLEFARSLPRFRALVDANERSGDLNRELTLGLVIKQNFSPICFPKLDVSSLVQPTPYQLGYSLVGPLLVGMAQWLIESARRDSIDRLYFLSREGQLIKQVYDLWSEGLEGLPRADYLVLSRRATSVPMIKSMEDIQRIAKDTYFPNTVTHFLFERFGLQLSDERWIELGKKTGWNSTSTVEVYDQHVNHLVSLLTALEAEIIASAGTEYAALKHYISSMGLEEDGRQAVVDVGYGGTIQGYLNRLAKRPVHGYYMMTDERSGNVAKAHDVLVRGCYLENVVRSDDAPQIYLRSFELEKFLSSNDTQVVNYALDQKNNLTAHHRALSDDEAGSSGFRNELQEGVRRYARDARNIRTGMFPAYRPSCAVARELYEAFITEQSPQEDALLKRIALDDHYCGREVVR